MKTLLKQLLVMPCLLSVLAAATSASSSSRKIGDDNEWIFDKFLRDWNRNTDEGIKTSSDVLDKPRRRRRLE